MFKTAMSKSTITGHSTSMKMRKKRAPPPEYFRLLFKKAAADFDNFKFKRSVKSNIAALQDMGRWSKEPKDIAIDLHKYARYDDKTDTKLCYGPVDDRYALHEKYMTAQVINEGETLVVSKHAMYKGDQNPNFVRKIIKDCEDLRLDIGNWLMDREFLTTQILQLLQGRGYTFLTICQNNAKTRRYLEEYKQGKRKRVSKRTISNGKGLSMDYYMIIEEIEKDGKIDYIPFATNNPRIDTKKYAKRWVIETGYRVVDKMRLPTTTKNESVRDLLFSFSLLFYNAWIIARNIDDENDPLNVGWWHIPQLTFRDLVLDYIELYREKWPPPKIAAAAC